MGVLNEKRCNNSNHKKLKCFHLLRIKKIEMFSFNLE